MNVLLNIVKGYLIGLANIIPGVSGGTLALILGMYERLIEALHAIDMRLAGSLMQALTLRKEALLDLRADLRRADALFLGLIGFGALLAILTTSRLMEYLLEHHHAPSYAFFFGVVLVSTIFPYRHMRRHGWKEVTAFLLAAGVTVTLTFTVSEERQIERARVKQALARAETAGTPTPDAAEGGVVSLTAPSARQSAWIFLSAAIAISAMVLPGISGSFMLLLMGSYFDILQAVNEREVVVLAVFCLGLVVGLLAFSRVMSVLLRRAHDVTMAFMIGLMAGSLWVLWPFKRVAVVGVETLYLGNTLPDSVSGEIGLSIMTALIGAGLIAVSCWIEWRTTLSPPA